MGRKGHFASTPWRDQSNLRHAYRDLGLSIRDIAERWDCSPETIRKWLGEHDIDTRSFGGRTGPAHHAWRGGHSDGAYYGASWWDIRPKVLKRDDKRCQICGIPQSEHRDKYGRGLEVHHITPFGSFDDHKTANQLNNLITMCQLCHRRTEQSAALNRAANRQTGELNHG
jgi:hypothetical protein